MRLSAWYLTAAIPIVAACSHASQALKADAPAPPPVAAVASPEPAPASAPAAPIANACSGDDQCGANELCLSSKCVEITPGLAECRTSARFDFDRSDLHPDELPKLQRDARCLNALPAERTLVEGNCDERGTAQYNIALGFRRAHAVAKYLEDLGVPPVRLSEVSYGKELPLCSESTESCWAMNRRADVSRDAKPKDVTAMVRADERRERATMTVAAPAQASHASAAARHPAQARRREQPAAVESNAGPTK